MSVKISFVMSVYNAEEYIDKCIRSILNQKFKDFECIVIDDASTDNTYQLLSAYNDNRLIIIKNEENRGLTKNLNYAIRLSKGEYIARMDGDDICCCDRLQVQYDYMKAHPEIDILGSNAYLIDENDKIVGATIECYTNEEIQAKLQLLNPMLHPTVFMKGSVIRQFMYNENYRTCQDFELWNRIGSKCKFANISQETIFYRLNQSGATRAAKKNVEKRISMLYDILREYRKGKFLSINDNEMKALIGVTLQYHRLVDDNEAFEIYRKVSEPIIDRIMAPSLIRFNWKALQRRKMITILCNGLLYWLKYIIKQFWCKYFDAQAKLKLKNSVAYN